MRGRCEISSISLVVIGKKLVLVHECCLNGNISAQFGDFSMAAIRIRIRVVWGRLCSWYILCMVGSMSFWKVTAVKNLILLTKDLSGLTNCAKAESLYLVVCRIRSRKAENMAEVADSLG